MCFEMTVYCYFYCNIFTRVQFFVNYIRSICRINAAIFFSSLCVQGDATMDRSAEVQREFITDWEGRQFLISLGADAHCKNSSSLKKLAHQQMRTTLLRHMYLSLCDCYSITENRQARRVPSGVWKCWKYFPPSTCSELATLRLWHVLSDDEVEYARPYSFKETSH